MPSRRSALALAAALLTIVPAAAQQPRPSQLPPPGPPQIKDGAGWKIIGFAAAE